jgi:hypothetical protein
LGLLISESLFEEVAWPGRLFETWLRDPAQDAIQQPALNRIGVANKLSVDTETTSIDSHSINRYLQFLHGLPD